MSMPRLLLMAAIAVGLAMAAWFVAERRERVSVDDAEFYPGMLTTINSVKRLVKKDKDTGTMTLVQNADGGWLLEERNNYPASAEQVRKFLRGFAEMRRLEPKTGDPKKYAKLGVGPVAEDENAQRFTLYGEGDDVIADLIMGNDRPATADTDLREVYVRKADEKASWLIESDIRVLRNVSAWLESELLTVHRDRIQQIFIDHPGDDDDVFISRSAPDVREYTLRDVPDDKRVDFSFQLGDVATGASALDLEDVFPDEGIDFGAESSIRTTIDTFDGLRVVMVTGDRDGVTLARFQAGESGRHRAEGGSEHLLDAAAVKQEIETLNARWSGWAYRVRRFKFENLTNRKNAFLVDKDAAPTGIKQ